MPPKEFSFSICHLDPEMSGRMRFKESTIPIHQFNELQQWGSLDEALARMGNGTKYDIVFMSYRFALEEITRFVKEAAATGSGHDAVFVQIIKSNEHGSALASNMLAGADGVLLEPFSVDSLFDIANLAMRVKKEKSDARERAALSFMLNDIINQIDRVAFLKSSNMELGKTMPQLRKLCEILRTLDGDSLKVYYEIAIEAFEKAPLPTNLTSKFKRYSGASSRVKKAMEEKLRKELEDIK